jgi:hypothetical protein
MKETEYLKGRYLFQERHYPKNLVELYILEVSKTSIKYQYLSGFTEWRSKESFNSKYELLERLY